MKTTRLKLKNLVFWLVGIMLVSFGLGFVITFTAGDIHFDHSKSGVFTKEDTIPFDNVKKVEAEVNMGIGELKISGDAQKLCEGEFTYGVGDWSPGLFYRKYDGYGKLEVRQPKIKAFYPYSNLYNDWWLKFSNDIPLDLNVYIGAGDSEINLSQLKIHKLRIHMGTGETILMLNGQYRHDVEVDIWGGMGKLIIYVPTEIGTKIEVDGGIRGVKAEGLIKNGDTFCNGVYGRTANAVWIRIEAGLGEILLMERE